MKRSSLFFWTLLVALYLGSVPASAQRGNRPTTAGVSHGPSSHASSTAARSSTDTSPNPNSSPGSVFSHSPNLATNLTNALSKSGISVPGGNLATFCSGNNFKTLGQCIAALHINHKFSTCTFTDLSGAKSLGAAIHSCNPNVDAKAEASKAMKQANADIKGAKS